MNRDLSICRDCEHLRLLHNSELLCTNSGFIDASTVERYTRDGLYRRLNELCDSLLASRPHISRRFEDTPVSDECENIVYMLRRL